MSENQANQAQELGKLLGRPLRVTIGGEELELRPFTFGHLDQVLEIVQPFLDDLQRMPRLQVFKKHRDQVYGLIALLSGRDRMWIEQLPATEGLRLFTACVEANDDFFSQGLPQLSVVMRLLPSGLERYASSGQAPTSAEPQSATPASTEAQPASSSATGSASPSS